MFDLDKYEEIWQSITRNKVRSLLTCFGVFWGILMLVLLLGAGNGLKNGMIERTKGFATNSIFFFTNQTGEPYKGFKQGRWWQMKYGDLDMIRERIEGIEYMTPMLFTGSSENNVVRGTKTGTFGVRGCYGDYFYIERQNVLHGRLLNEMDAFEKRKVCVIGKRVMETLFGAGENPIGTYIRVNGVYFQVVGVIDPVSTNFSIGGHTQEAVFLPATTMRQAYNMGDKIYFLCLTVDKGYKGADIENQVKTLLKERNQISPTDPQALSSINLEERFRSFEVLFTGIAILIWMVGIGTLLSGVIGVTNILLVTVKERTKEIGVRRALGAKPSAIISQLLSESLTITFLAGILGLVAGIGLLDLANNMLVNSPADVGFIQNPEVPFGTAVVATLILLLSGLVGGIIPAWRALQIKAIDAIREE